MKRIISSKFAIFTSMFSSSIFLVFSLISLLVVIEGTVEEKVNGLIIFIFFTTMSIFMLWYLNRAACIVWIEDGIIKRKGLICGFYKECPIKSINKVVISYSRKEGDFIYLVDNSTFKFYRIRKDSYIAFRKTKKNIEFVQTFWSKDIEK